MSMYKRPPIRTNEFRGNKSTRPVPGDFIYNIIHPLPTEIPTRIRKPVYNQDNYLTLLEKNYVENNLVFKKPNLPDYTVVPTLSKTPEPYIYDIDRVYMKLKILKSGIIRVKLNTSFTSLYEKYYSQNKIPSMKTLVQAYKSFDFSDEFINVIKKRYEKRVAFSKKISNIIDDVFNKEKPKKRKKEEEEVPKDDECDDGDPVDEDDPHVEDDDPGEDGEMDVEIDDDEDVEDPPAEEYLSD